MYKEIFGVFKNSVTYGIPGISSTIAAVFLIPIFTRVLSPQDYGIVSLFSILIVVLVIIFDFGMSTALFRFYFNVSTREKKTVASSSFFFQLIIGIVLTFSLIIFAPVLNQLLFKGTQPIVFLYLIILTVLFKANLNVPLAILRAKKRPQQYSFLTLSSLFLSITLSIIFVVVFRMGVLGVILANFVSFALVYLASLPYIFKFINFSISVKKIKEMLHYGTPLIPAGIALWVIHMSDRYLLNIFVDISSVGIYSVGYRIGAAVVIVISSIQLAFSPFVHSVSARPDAKTIYKVFAKYYLFFIAFIVLSTSVFSKELIQILTGPKFHEAYVLIPIIAFAHIPFGLYFVFSLGVAITKKTIFTTISTTFAAISNLGLNFILIPLFGITGAAASTLIAFSVLMLSIWYFSQRFYKVDYEYKNMVLIVVVSILIFYLSQLISLDSFVLSIAVKLGLLLSYFLILFILGLFSYDEKMKLFNLFKNPGGFLKV